MITPETAWTPLPESEWNRAAARHLALRIGFSLHEDLVDYLERNDPQASLGNVFGKIRPMPPPESVLGMRESMVDYRNQYREADPLEKRKLRQERQKQGRESYAGYGIDWYHFARDPAHSPQEKLVLFFENVWVVSFSGVRDVADLYDYQTRIRRSLAGTYPEMCKALALSPAMMRYLNLNQNRKGSPNENFARELFELFCLGEGHYTESDIKEAARALTGYTVNQAGKARLVEIRHDSGKKTIFGKADNFDLDGLIDLVFEQPAAARFLPQELCRSYLTEEGLPEEMIEPLAETWKASGFSIAELVRTFFTSRIFYAPEYRGNMIKSPVQFYIGLLQDLELDVFPSPRRTNNILRSMGQPFFNPPNVRGWVGGRNWINSATLAARRQLVESVLLPVSRDRLNADEEAAVAAAEAAGKGNFTVARELLLNLGDRSPEELAQLLAARFYATPDPALLSKLLEESEPSERVLRRGAAALATALNTPQYHLC